MSRAPFWKQGIRFECQGTGRCCTSRGSYGYVYLTIEDRRRLARHFAVTTSAFTRRYCAKSKGHYHLKDLRDCPFLYEKRCAVYSARPTQCRTWPFWPENMSPRTWKRDVVAFCPGVGKGKLFTATQIRQRLDIDPCL